MLIEICANSLESAVNAEKAGADRIEFCLELGLGGITPSFGMLKTIREHISIPVHVLVRPRSGDFYFSDFEFEGMLKDIELCRELGFDGIVSGVLTQNFSLDLRRTALLVKEASGLCFTFHRAFDWVVDPLLVLRQLEDLGVQRILSSGQQRTALQGIELLSDLKSMASNCAIMPGGGVNLANVLTFKNAGFDCVHLSAATLQEVGLNKENLPMSYSPYLEERCRITSNAAIISEIVNKVK
ncbi:copper homeostasis protein CutC [Cellulophaga sp. E16_2]|uniref:copper homeostasis protein CutC n=1 Tax=Cellulophaga sp. E16_2 TaxID=2789297 RepID=UPI001A917128|nr:copper homeostasis protein CutC [Cellulophaga sp. E16_2]MBO0591797.1 copper homeostasis protein CutC [Cellulophaga sp. E16_2]